MRLKAFRAPSATQAMARIRVEFGEEALILGSRRLADGVEVTAAIEPELVTPVMPLSPHPTLGMQLAYHGIPDDLHATLSVGNLADGLARAIRFVPLPLDEPILLVGPPGGGKTLTTARLATRLVMQGTAPLVVTTDGQRAGAVEQLAAFTRLLRINLVVANNPVTLGRAIAKRAIQMPVLIDSAGTDPFVSADRDGIRALAATADARVVVVLPAGLDAAEAADLACAYRETGASMMIATRLDLARRLGGLIAAVARSGLALTEGGIGPGAADGLKRLTAADLASRITSSGKEVV